MFRNVPGSSGMFRVLSTPILNNLIWFIKSNFLEAIKIFRLSISAIIIVLSKFLPLRALKTEKKVRGCQRGAYLLVWHRE